MQIHKPTPQIIEPFPEVYFNDLRQHVREVRRIFDWPGAAYHDKNDGQKFNRWCWHNLPIMANLHHMPQFIEFVSKLAGQPLKPSYSFLSMYGKDGVCPLHTDRPQCQFTVDLQIESDGSWPIYVDEKPYVLKEGQALFYSGTGQPHYRNPMSEDSVGRGNRERASFMNLAFFHFVPTSWVGSLE